MDKVGFHLERQFTSTGPRTQQTGNQSQCATGQRCTSESPPSRLRREITRQRLPRITLSDFQLAVFRTYYVSLYACTIKDGLAAVGSHGIRRAFHDTLCLMKKEKNTHLLHFTAQWLPETLVLPHFFAGFKLNLMFKQMMNVPICVTTAQC